MMSETFDTSSLSWIMIHEAISNGGLGTVRPKGKSIITYTTSSYITNSLSSKGCK